MKILEGLTVIFIINSIGLRVCCPFSVEGNGNEIESNQQILNEKLNGNKAKLCKKRAKPDEVKPDRNETKRKKQS
jgi:hypothetical protein